MKCNYCKSTGLVAVDRFVNTFQHVRLLITGPTSFFFEISLDLNKTLTVTNTSLLHRGYNGSVFSNYPGLIMWSQETTELILWCLVFWINLSL